MSLRQTIGATKLEYYDHHIDFFDSAKVADIGGGESSQSIHVFLLRVILKPNELEVIVVSKGQQQGVRANQSKEPDTKRGIAIQSKCLWELSV